VSEQEWPSLVSPGPAQLYMELPTSSWGQHTYTYYTMGHLGRQWETRMVAVHPCTRGHHRKPEADVDGLP
jgi:hypothetical protein